MEAKSEENRSINPPAYDVREPMNPNKAYNIRTKAKPQKFKYSLEDQYEYGEKLSVKQEPTRRGRPSGKRDLDGEYRREPNPYEKGLYKKRRSYHDDPKDGSAGRQDHHINGESEDDKDQDNYAGKSAQDERSDFASEKIVKGHEERGRAGRNQGNGNDAEYFTQIVELYKKNWEIDCRFALAIDSDSV